jgi:hypothetical protein
MDTHCIHTLLLQVDGSTGGHAPPTYSYPPSPAYPYTTPQHIHSSSDKDKEKGEWTYRDEENLVGVNFILSLPFFRLLPRTYKLIFHVHAWLMHFVDCIEGNVKPEVKF